MSDLIRRQDAIDAIVNTPSKVQNKNISLVNQYDGAAFRQIEILGILEALSTAEPERKKGEWVYDGIRGRFPACKCSICGHYENADWALLQGVNYCPHCGAKMRGE